MDKQLGLFEVCCDAPPYWVTRASYNLGVREPEDVRWLRMSAFRRQKRPPARGLLGSVLALFRRTPPRTGERCSCGAPVPELSVPFVVVDGREPTYYRLGQCPRCRTVFWETP